VGTIKQKGKKADQALTGGKKLKTRHHGAQLDVVNMIKTHCMHV
jgi:hypothetical protein